MCINWIYKTVKKNTLSYLTWTMCLLTWLSLSSAISATTRDSMNFTRSLPWTLVWQEKTDEIMSVWTCITSNLYLYIFIDRCFSVWPAACGWHQRWSSALWCACVTRCDCLCTARAYSSLQTPPSSLHVLCGSQTVEFSSGQPEPGGNKTQL